MQAEIAEKLNSLCRGGSGDNPATMEACRQRDAVYAEIGKSVEPMAQAPQQPVWKSKQDAEDAESKMRSFDRATAGRTALVFATQLDEITPRSAMVAILYQNTPCSLPFADAKHLRAAESLYGPALVPACWGRLVSPLNDEVVIITKFGDSRRESLINYAEMKIRTDGSGQFVKRAYSPEDYRRNVDAYQKSMR